MDIEHAIRTNAFLVKNRLFIHDHHLQHLSPENYTPVFKSLKGRHYKKLKGDSGGWSFPSASFPMETTPSHEDEPSTCDDSLVSSSEEGFAHDLEKEYLDFLETFRPLYSFINTSARLS